MSKYKKILVTGGNGFIGKNFIIYMLEKYSEIKIINIDKKTYASNNNYDLFLKYKTRYQEIEEDILNIKNIKNNKLLKSVKCIVNFAAESHVDKSIEDSLKFIKTNINGTHALLEYARMKNLRFHHISTDEVFGSIKEGSFNESSPYDPKSPYSASKAASDHLVRAYYNTYGLPITITNCSNNYGPYQHSEKLIPLCINNTIKGIKTPIYGDGKNIRDWIYVEDHCRAVDLVLQNGRIGETYCIGGDSEKQNIEIVETILDNLGEKYENFIEYVEDRKGHDRRYSVDSSKINKELSWFPKISFEEGIKKTINWYMNSLKNNKGM